MYLYSWIIKLIKHYLKNTKTKTAVSTWITSLMSHTLTHTHTRTRNTTHNLILMLRVELYFMCKHISTRCAYSKNNIYLPINSSSIIHEHEFVR